MTLIKSISGIRGTIGGSPGEGLSPYDIVKFVSGYAKWVIGGSTREKPKVVVGRDARVSGEMVDMLVTGTLCGSGVDVLNLGLASTPTVEVAVMNEGADGGVIITASHNPGNWNALKLLNSKGEFISDIEGKTILDFASSGSFIYAEVDNLGSVEKLSDFDEKHIEMILELSQVQQDKIKEAGFTVAIDSVNSVGGIVLPKLLRRLGVKEIIEINSEPTGIFSHNPEPLPENLGELVEAVKSGKADVGFVVDPDVDRLAIVSENGELFNEEYTLVAVSDYILSREPGNTVSNMSSTRALRGVTEKYGGSWYSSAVGEVNVVQRMKEVGAVIGGEGNGGVIFPALHYGRDALVGIALFLSYLATSELKCSDLRKTFPELAISKKRIDLPVGTDSDRILSILTDKYNDKITSREDGILIETIAGWVQVRKSNTEPIIRIYSEAENLAAAEKLASDIIKSVKNSI